IAAEEEWHIPFDQLSAGLCLLINSCKSLSETRTDLPNFTTLISPRCIMRYANARLMLRIWATSCPLSKRFFDSVSMFKTPFEILCIDKHRPAKPSLKGLVGLVCR